MKNTLPIIGIFLCSLVFFVKPLDLTAEQTVYVQFHGENAFTSVNPDQWRKIGVDQLVVRVFRNQSPEGGMLFKNSQFRVVRPALTPFLAGIPESGPKIWAWMISRRFDWIGEKGLLDREYRKGTRHILAKFDLFNPEAMARVIEAYRELSEINPGGILIQDDLVIRSREGMSDRGLLEYARATGRMADPDEMVAAGSLAHQQWVKIKTRQVTAVLTSLVAVCKQTRPGIQVGINVYYEAPLFRKRALSWYGHDLELLNQTGVDRIFLMAYHRQMQREMKLNPSAMFRLFSQMVKHAKNISGKKLVIKIQVRDWHSGEWLPEKELVSLFRRIPSGVGGICLTPVRPGDLARIQHLVTRFRESRVYHQTEIERGNS